MRRIISIIILIGCLLSISIIMKHYDFRQSPINDNGNLQISMLSLIYINILVYIISTKFGKKYSERETLELELKKKELKVIKEDLEKEILKK